jgi:hypothetical protein
MHKIKQATGLFKWFLTTFNYGAITMPWGTIHVREELMNQKKLIDHELVHIEQIKQLGPIKWTLTYLYYQIQYGYLNNPFEIEARKKSGW